MTQDETIKLQETIKEKILAEAKEGNIVVVSVDGLMVGKTQEIIKQSIETLLYDLNRDEMTILTFLPDIKWINDFASTQVIRALKKRVEELEEKTDWVPFPSKKMPELYKDYLVKYDLLGKKCVDIMTFRNTERLGQRFIKIVDMGLGDGVVSYPVTHWKEIEL